MAVSRGRRLAESWLAACSRVERAVTFIAFCAVIAVVFADVVSRELTGAGLHWARQAGVYANLVVVMFGLGLASASGAHLRPRFADGWLPAAWRPWLERIADALMALFCIGFATVAAGVVFDSWLLGERSTILRTPVWPVQAVIPLAFALAALRHALYAAYPALRPRSDALPPVPAGGEAERR